LSESEYAGTVSGASADELSVVAVLPAEGDELDGPASRKSGKPLGRWLGEWLLILLLATTSAFVIRTYVFQTFYIPSGSMLPTLQIGDRIIVSKLSTTFGTVHRGDILVFRRPPAENCGGPVVNDLVKRVIGLPGDHLSSRGNTILVNGHPLKETWSHIEPLGTSIGYVVVPKHSYFMMGDNHPESCDSRMWGPLDGSLVVGRVIWRIWPLSHFGHP
jgi:signal peptidase I